MCYCWTLWLSFSKFLSDLALPTTVSLLGTVFSLPQLAFTPGLCLPVLTQQGGPVSSTTPLGWFISVFWDFKMSFSTFFSQAAHTLGTIFFMIHYIKTMFSFSSVWLIYPWRFRITSGISWWHKLVRTVGCCTLWHVQCPIHSKVSIT